MRPASAWPACTAAAAAEPRKASFSGLAAGPNQQVSLPAMANSPTWVWPAISQPLANSRSTASAWKGGVKLYSIWLPAAQT